MKTPNMEHFLSGTSEDTADLKVSQGFYFLGEEFHFRQLLPHCVARIIGKKAAGGRLFLFH